MGDRFIVEVAHSETGNTIGTHGERDRQRSLTLLPHADGETLLQAAGLALASVAFGDNAILLERAPKASWPLHSPSGEEQCRVRKRRKRKMRGNRRRKRRRSRGRGGGGEEKEEEEGHGSGIMSVVHLM